MDGEEIAKFVLDILNEEEEEDIQRFRFRQSRMERQLLRDTSNPFTLDPEYFRKYYRMVPEVVIRLIDLVHNRIVPQRENGIPQHQQVLIVLRFLAEGSLQKGFSQDFQHPVSQATASRFITKVIDAINDLSHMFVKFPTPREERQHIQNDFQRTIRIPGVIGLGDRFLVKMKRPTENKEAFYNYRAGHSMNVQIIVDAEYNILSLRICTASNNDRYVWQFPEAREYMEYLRANENIMNEEGSYYILGDSGYTPSPVLLTPVLNAAEGTPEFIYTSEHVRTRCKIEQTIGILSNIWMAIKRSRQLHYSPEKVGNIINASAILHNLRRMHGLQDELVEDIQPFEEEIIYRSRDYPAGMAERNQIINQYYM